MLRTPTKVEGCILLRKGKQLVRLPARFLNMPHWGEVTTVLANEVERAETDPEGVEVQDGANRGSDLRRRCANWGGERSPGWACYTNPEPVVGAPTSAAVALVAVIFSRRHKLNVPSRDADPANRQFHPASPVCHPVHAEGRRSIPRICRSHGRNLPAARAVPVDPVRSATPFQHCPARVR